MPVNYYPLSPVELVTTYIKSAVAADLAANKDAGLSLANIKPGAVTITQQQAGAASIVEAGKPRLEPSLPLLWQRVAVRCSGETYEVADRIGNYVRELTDKKNRVHVTQASGAGYIIHSMDVTAGNTINIADQKTWETILYITTLIGTQPVA